MPTADTAMRTTTIFVLMLALLAGCGGIEFRRGLPALAKPLDGGLVAGTDGGADLARGNQSRLAGRLDDAVRDLKPLAELGYPEAMLYLAATYGLQTTPEAEGQSIAWYRRALAERPEALVPLARAMMQSSRGSAVKESESLLLGRLAQREDPQAQGALLDLYGLFPALDSTHRAAALAKTAERSPVPELRISAINWTRDNVADRAGAQHLIELCRANLDIAPDCHIDLAAYHRYRGEHEALVKEVAAALRDFDRVTPLVFVDSLDAHPVDVAEVAGRFATVLVEQRDPEGTLELDESLREARVEAAMIHEEAAEEGSDVAPADDPLPQLAGPATTAATAHDAASGSAEPELASQVLQWMLKRPGAMPVEAAGVAVAFPYLLPGIDLIPLLQAGVDAHLPRASLLLGELYFFGQRALREADLAEANFIVALAHRETGVAARYRLGRLYQQGYLGRPDPEQSLANFLYAARHRVSAADLHLSRLFYDSPGMRVDRVNSWVFARLSEDAGFPSVVRSLRTGVLVEYNLLQRLNTDLTASELQRAKTMYVAEQRVHLVAHRNAGQRVWAEPAEAATQAGAP